MEENTPLKHVVCILKTGENDMKMLQFDVKNSLPVKGGKKTGGNSSHYRTPSANDSTTKIKQV